MADFAQARRLMVDTQLRTSNITDRRLLAAMGRVPRELFVPEKRRGLAYIDDVHPLTEGGSPRYLPSPAPFGRLLQLAQIDAGDTVLDIGCVTGYSAAVMADLARHVTAVESDPDLAAKARENLATLAISNVDVVEAPLDQGPTGSQTFDVVMVEGALEVVPETLLDRIKDGGRLVALVREGATASAKVYVRAGSDVAARTEFDANLPLLEIVKRDQEFVF